MLKSLTFYAQPRLVAIAFLGFSSGLPLALVLGTLSLWLAKEGIDKSTIGVFAAVGSPYTLKFLWSHLPDHLPIPFLTQKLGKRRGWLLFTQALLMVGLLFLGASDPTKDIINTAYFAFFVALFSATQDIVVDAFRVESLPAEEQAAGAAMVVFGYRIGMLVSGVAALFIAADFGWFAAYAVMAAFVSVGMITALMVKEPEHPKPKKEIVLGAKARLPYAVSGVVLVWVNYMLYRVQEAIVGGMQATIAGVTVPFGSIMLWIWVILSGFLLLGIVVTLLTGKSPKTMVVEPFADFMTRKHWLLILCFIVFYKFGDAFAGVMTNPFLIDVGFSLKEIGTAVKTFGFFATLFGLFAGGWLVARVGMIKALWICGILQMVSNLMFLLQAWAGYNYPLLMAVIGVENLAGGMGTAVFVAYISGLCNIAFTATHYALLSALAATGRTWLSTSSGWFVEQLGWPEFFVLSTVLAVPGLALLWVVGRKDTLKQGGKVAL